MTKIFVLLSALLLTEGADLPSYFAKCKKTDPNLSDCLVKSVNEAWPKFVEAYNIDNIPLNEVSKVIPNFITGHINGYVSGFRTINFSSIYIDFNKRTFDVIYDQPLASMVGDYEMKGGFLGFSLDDKGHTNVSHVNGVYKYHFNYEVETRDDGEDYFQLTTFQLSQNIRKMVVDLTSTENPERGEIISKLFNRNWRILNILTQNALAEIFSEAYSPIVREFLNKIPVKNMFLDVGNKLRDMCDL